MEKYVQLWDVRWNSRKTKRLFFVALCLFTYIALPSSYSLYYYFLRKPFNMYQQTTPAPSKKGEKTHFYKVKIGLLWIWLSWVRRVADQATRIPHAVTQKTISTGRELIRLPFGVLCVCVVLCPSAEKMCTREKKKTSKTFNVIQKVSSAILCHLRTFFYFFSFSFWWKQFTICYNIEIASALMRILAQRDYFFGLRPSSTSFHYFYYAC